MAAAQFTILGINAAKPFVDNAEYWKEKAGDKIQKIRRKSMTRIYGDQSGDEDDRSERSGVRPRGGYVASSRRSKSVNNDSDYSSDDSEYYSRRSSTRGRGRRTKEYRNYDAAEDSEDSVGPRDRNNAMVKRNGNEAVAPYNGSNGQTGTRSENDRDDDSDSSSVMDSEEDEHQMKKKKREEMISGGLAAIATLNAAANVYGSMKMREARNKALADGTMTKEEAKKQRFKLHLQDAAAIGVSVLACKGAYAKWQAAADKHRGKKSHRSEREERRDKRMRKGVSRQNRSSSREAAARMGRPAPGYEEMAQQYANADSGPVRPAYNRAYSRSLDDVRAGNYRYPDYGRSYGRRKNNKYVNPDAPDYYDGYDGDGAGAGDAGGD